MKDHSRFQIKSIQKKAVKEAKKMPKEKNEQSHNVVMMSIHRDMENLLRLDAFVYGRNPERHKHVRVPRNRHFIRREVRRVR